MHSGDARFLTRHRATLCVQVVAAVRLRVVVVIREAEAGNGIDTRGTLNARRSNVAAKSHR